MNSASKSTRAERTFMSTLKNIADFESTIQTSDTLSTIINKIATRLMAHRPVTFFELLSADIINSQSYKILAKDGKNVHEIGRNFAELVADGILVTNIDIVNHVIYVDGHIQIHEYDETQRECSYGFTE